MNRVTTLIAQMKYEPPSPNFFSFILFESSPNRSFIIYYNKYFQGQAGLSPVVESLCHACHGWSETILPLLYIFIILLNF